MVKIDENSCGPDLPQSVRSNNGNCLAEASEAVLKRNGISHHGPKVSAVNGISADKASVKGNPWGCANGKCAIKLPVNGVPLLNGNYNNKQAVKEKPTVNGYSKKVTNDTPTVYKNSGKKQSVNGIQTVNGDSGKKQSVNNVSTVNSNSAVKAPINDVSTFNDKSVKIENVNDAPTVNGNSDKLSVDAVPIVNGKCGDSSPIEVPVYYGNSEDKSSVNCSNTPSEKGSCSNVHIYDSLCNEENSEENQLGFIEVVNKKKRNKNRQKNHRKKPSFNLPPGMNAESIRCDKGNDKKLGEKTTSPTHTSQKPPTRNFAAIRSSGKSYSSALLNGQTANSQLSNGVSKVFTDPHNVTNIVKPNKSANNCELPGTPTSADHLLTDAAKSAVIKDTSAVKCKQSNSSTKVEMTDVSAQTDACLQIETTPSQKECLTPCEKVIIDSEISSLQVEVDDVDFIGETDDSSNAAYPESVVSNDSGRGESEVTYDEQMPYCCEFPKEKVKNLIGRHGRYRFEVQKQTGVTFWVPKNLFVDEDTAVVAFTGTGAQIEKAKELIKKRFHLATLKQWPGMQGEQWLNSGPSLSDSFSATLPVGTDFMGVVSCIFTPHYFWLQQWGHPEFHPLEDLERRMSLHFNTVVDAPGVANPMIGNVVAVPVFVEGEAVKWVRGEIINIIPETGNVVARYLDHGGESVVPASEIRPMRHEFLSIPFFAAKCCLFSVLPEGGVWSEESCAEFKRLCSSNHHPPLVKVIVKVPEGYFVSILGYDDETNMRVDVADTLIKKGLAQFDCKIFQPPEPSNELVH